MVQHETDSHAILRGMAFLEPVENRPPPQRSQAYLAALCTGCILRGAAGDQLHAQGIHVRTPVSLIKRWMWLDVTM